MADERHLATVNGYQGLIAAIRARKEELRMSDRDLEELAGLTPGHVSKILTPGANRVLGPLSMGRILRTLGIDLIVAENIERTEQIREQFVPRVEERVNKKTRMHSVGVQIEVTRKFLKEIGTKGGANSRKYLTRRQAKAIAKKAARARWDRVREAQA